MLNDYRLYFSLPYDVDVTDTLAQFLQASRENVLQSIGGAWYRMDVVAPVGDRARRRQWFGSGAPLQVLIGLSPSSVLVAAPQFQWEDTHALTLKAGHVTGSYDRVQGVDVETLSKSVREAEELRRAMFGYCRYCRGFTGPEQGWSREEPTCYSCMERYLGFVF